MTVEHVPDHEHEHSCDHEHSDTVDVEIVGPVDSLPDRPLTMAEFRELQHSDRFESVTTAEGAREIDALFVTANGERYLMTYLPPGCGVVSEKDTPIDVESPGWYQYQEQDT